MPKFQPSSSSGSGSYADSDAISAVEGESTLVLSSGVTVGTDLKMSTSSDDVIIENVTQDKDVIFKVNDGGVSSESMRIDGDINQVKIKSLGIGTAAELTITESSDDITIKNTVSDKDIIFNINDGGSDTEVMRIDGSESRVGIGTNTPAATLDIASGSTFRNTRLLTVAVSAGTTLTEAAHAGRYNICAGNVTLPSTSTAGEHYAILNTTGGNITISRNGRNINGAGSDFTLATFKAATCIAIGSNNWMVVG